MIENLTERMKLLLIYLKNHNEARSDELAALTNVSSRTIKSDIAKLSEMIEEYGASIVAKRGQGYRLEIDNQEKFELLASFLEIKNRHRLMEVPKTSIERTSYLIRKLLMIDYPIKIDELAEEVYVSRQTMQLVLKEVRKILSNYELFLSTSNEGVMIQGDEIQKRRCINDSVFQNNQEFFVQNNLMFSSELSQKEIRFVREALLHVLNEHNIRFSDLSVQNMVIHIMIAIRRYQFYQYVEIEEQRKKKMMLSPYYLAASDLIAMLEKQFSVVLPEDEAVYLAIHIQSKAIIMHSDMKKEESEEIDELLYNIYRRIKKRFHISLFLNHELNEFLKLHIPAMVERVRNKLYMRNPLLHETMRHYQYAVEVCMEAVDEIEQWFDICLDENEFAYLVLYFNLALSKLKTKAKRRIILICGHGRPEMILILNQLNEKFAAQIGDIITLDIYELNSFLFEANDVLITTIPITIELEIPFIYVHGRIEDYYDEINLALSASVVPHLSIENYLSRERFITNMDCEDKEVILEELGRMLIKEVGDLRAREIINHICMKFSEVGKGCVILHSTVDCPIPFVALFSLKTPILWNRTYVKKIWFCGLSVCDQVVSETLYSLIANWCECDYLLTNDYEQVCASFSN